MINIFSTRNTPYARLSNNFKQEMRIGGLSYPTVTNYIYANMLTTSTYKVIISRAKPRGMCTGKDGDCTKHKRSRVACEAANCTYEFSSVGNQFSVLYDEERNDRRKNAIETALISKLEQNLELAQTLLDTGNKPIIYVSLSKWMGTGGDANDGENNYGKLLEAARDKLVGERDQRIRVKNEHVREENIYLIYIAYSNMARLIRSGDNLDEYDGKTAPEIIKKMEDNEVIVSLVPGKEVIVADAKKKQYGVVPSGPGGILKPDMFVALRKPKVLSAMVRGRYLRNEREKKLRRVSSLILNMYCDYLLKKAFQRIMSESLSKKIDELDQEDYDKARKQQLNTMSREKRNKTRMEIENLYNEGMLSESLSKKIDEAIKLLNIPSEEDIEDAESMVNAILENVGDEVQTSKMFSKSSSDRVLIWENDPPPTVDTTYNLKGLSPLDDSTMINIGGKIYPSITYYCIAVELASCCIKSRRGKKGYQNTLSSKAYEMLRVEGSDRFLDLRTLEKKLDRLGRQFYKEKLIKNTQEALNKKFENRLDQNVLLSTKENKLVWDDRNDPILGGYGPEAFNFVGKELMRMRTSIRANRKKSGDLGDLEEVLSLKVLNRLFQNDFLKGWFNMRVRDMCNVILAMKDYLFLKYTIKQELTPKFVASVIDDVYQPCSHIFAVASEIKSPVPVVFIRMVQNYKGFLQFTTDQEKVLDIMWKRLAVVIYYLVKHLETATSINIAIVLKKAEVLASLTKNCTKIIPDEKENCIFSALLNIISGINTVDKKLYGIKSGLQKIDFNTAVTILLNINSLAEQRAMQRKTSKGGGDPTDVPQTPPIPPVSRVTEEDIYEIRAKLSGAPYWYKNEVILKVIDEVTNAGQVPNDNILVMLAMAAEHQPSPTENDVNRTKRRPKLRLRKRKKTPDGLSPPSGEPPDSWEELRLRREEDLELENGEGEEGEDLNAEPSFPFKRGDDEEDLEFEDDIEDVFDVEKEIDDNDEDDTSFTPDPVVSEKIRKAFLDAGVAIEDDDESFVFMVDDAIDFVNSYKLISNKMKTNRINFFAGS